MSTVTVEMAELCAEFMLDYAPADELAAPVRVLGALYEYKFSETEEAKKDALMRLASSIQIWLTIDRASCVSLLGPGLGLEQ